MISSFLSTHVVQCSRRCTHMVWQQHQHSTHFFVENNCGWTENVCVGKCNQQRWRGTKDEKKVENKVLERFEQKFNTLLVFCPSAESIFRELLKFWSRSKNKWFLKSRSKSKVISISRGWYRALQFISSALVS